VVQVYLQGRNCGVMRPVAELKGYGRFELKAGEKRRISLSLDPEAFHFYNADMEYGMHDSDYTLSVGTSCKKIAQTFELSVRNGKIILK
jgi:beta-glucosidase